MSLRQPNMRPMNLVAGWPFRRAGESWQIHELGSPEASLNAGPGASWLPRRLVAPRCCWLAYAPGAIAAQANPTFHHQTTPALSHMIKTKRSVPQGPAGETI